MLQSVGKSREIFSKYIWDNSMCLLNFKSISYLVLKVKKYFCTRNFIDWNFSKLRKKIAPLLQRVGKNREFFVRYIWDNFMCVLNFESISHLILKVKNYFCSRNFIDWNFSKLRKKIAPLLQRVGKNREFFVRYIWDNFMCVLNFKTISHPILKVKNCFCSRNFIDCNFSKLRKKITPLLQSVGKNRDFFLSYIWDNFMCVLNFKSISHPILKVKNYFCSRNFIDLNFSKLRKKFAPLLQTVGKNREFFVRYI